MPGKQHDARKYAKNPWGSDEFRALLKKFGIDDKAKGAMSSAMELDFASRDKRTADMVEACRELALVRVFGSTEGEPEGAQQKFVDKLTVALMKEYEKIDTAFQSQFPPPPQPPEEDDADEEENNGLTESQDFNAMIKRARQDAANSFRAGKPDEAKKFVFSFADSAIKSGFWKKPAKNLVVPMLKAAAADAKKTKVDAAADADVGAQQDFDAASTEYYDTESEDSADVNFGLNDVNKVDMKQVASVYGFGEDDVDMLHSLARDVVKKGADNPGVHKSAKDLVTQSKKKKNKPKVSNASYLAHALMDAVRKAVSKKKVTKPMKKNEEV